MASLSPSACSFGQVVLNDPVSPETVTFTASADGTYSASITGDDATRFALTTALSHATIAKDAQKELYVAYLDTIAGTHAATLSVTDADGATVATCALSGETRANDEPWVYGDQSSLAFGRVDVGTSSLGAVTIQSLEDGATYTYACSLASGAVFSISQTSGSGSGGVALSLMVTFTPTAEVSSSDTLTVSWSRTAGDPTSGTITLALSGTGVLDATDSEADDTSSMAANLQRATISVPSYESIVNLGAGYVEELATVTQTGFSVTTTRNVFFQAAKTVTVQAEGHAWFQSTDDVAYLMSGSNTYLVADQTMYLTGGAYLGLMAGYGSSAATDIAFDSEGNPKTPSTASDVNVGFIVAEILWQVGKKISSVYSLVKTIFDHACLDDPTSTVFAKTVPIGAIQGAFGVKATALFLIGSVVQYAYGRITGSDLQAVSLFSEAGLSSGTPAFTTIAGTLGTIVMGLNVTLMGYAHLTLEGVWSAGIDSFGDATVVAGKDITALAGYGKCTIASRAGALTLAGSTMRIGNYAPDPPAPTTLLLWMDAVTLLSFKALAPAVGEIALTCLPPAPGGFVMWATGDVAFTSVGNSTLGYPLAYRIEATAAGIMISNPKGPVVQLLPGTIILGPAAGAITMGPGVTDIGSGAITITPAAAICNAAAVDLL